MSGWHTTIHGVPAGFGAPGWLWAALAAIVVGAAATVWAARRRQTARGWVAPRLAARLVTGGGRRRAVMRTVLWTLGMALVACALARPQWGGSSEPVRRRGSDVVVVLDASRSMLARDVAPDRIGRAKLEVETLLDDLAGDRVGIVTFSSDAFVQMPLTTDYAAARTFLRQIDPSQLPQGGTNIGAGLRQAQELLASATDKSARTVLLFSDGEDWQGDAVDAAAALKKAGTTVYTIGVGSVAGAPTTSASGRTVLTKMDPTGLSAIAKSGGGAMWRGDGAIGEVAARLAAAQKSELEERRVVVYRERFQMVLAAGLALLALAAVAGDGRKRRASVARAAAAVAIAMALVGTHANAAEWTRAPEPTTSAGVRDWRAGKFGDALNAFANAKAKGDDAATLAYDRGTALYKLGRFDEARRELATAARGGGHIGAEASYALGDSLVKLGDDDGARTAYRHALEQEPDHADARHNLDLLLRKQDAKQQQKQDQQQQEKQQQKQKQNQQPQQDKQQQSQSQSQPQQKQQSQQKQSQQQQQQQQQPQQAQKQDDQKSQQRSHAQQQPGAQEPQSGQQQTGQKHANADERRELDRGGFGQPRSPEARRLLDSLQRDERVLPVWRFGANRSRKNDETDKDW